MLLGQARGKVGDLVFYVRNGSQQTRPRVREITNPRTQAQMYQRVKLAGVVGFYKRQASLFRFALRKKGKESYYNAFVRYNLNISPYLTRQQNADGWKVPAPYIISDGDMPQVKVTLVEKTDVDLCELSTDINPSWHTWGAMRRGMGLSYGDMMSIVIFFGGEDVADPTKRVVIQHVFDEDTENMAIGADMLGTDWRWEPDNLKVIITGTYFGLTEIFSIGACVVISRNSGGVDCSFAQLTLDDSAQITYDIARSEMQRDIAAASYGSEAEAIFDPRRADDNYAELVKIYTDQACTQLATLITLKGAQVQNLYFKPGEKPAGLSHIQAYDTNVQIGGLGFNIGTGNSFEAEQTELQDRDEDLTLIYYDANNSPIGYSKISIITSES